MKHITGCERSKLTFLWHICSKISNVVSNGKAYYQEYSMKDCQNIRTDCLGERKGLSITRVSSYSSLGRAFLLFLAKEFK
jgi:hypothetical protein